MRGSCGEVRAGACKHPSGWRPKFSVKYGKEGTAVTTKNLFVYDAQISRNGLIPDLFVLTLITFRHNSIVKVL